MLYDASGRPIAESSLSVRPSYGQNFIPEISDRETSDASRALTPSRISTIMTAANGGDTTEQSRLALELEEKNWDIAQAMETRRNAVLGRPWTIAPGADKSAAAKSAASALETELREAGSKYVRIGDDTVKLESFRLMLKGLLSSVIAGFAAEEIVWEPGGSIAGFRFLPQRHFTFQNSLSPRLLTTMEPQGIPLPPNKFLFLRNSRQGTDVERGGLIRPLAWLHCFQNINVKDLLRFIERYGMPFVVAKVDRESWENERSKIKALIRSFGPDGGAVFTRSTEFELLQAANNTGDVYFKLLEYCGQAIQKVILGQLASSDKSAGLSGGDAQSQVRQDILEADCTALEDCVNTDLIAPWHNFNSRAGTAQPRLKISCQPSEDLKSIAETVKTLYEGGFEADEAEMSEKFGMKLKRRTDMSAPQNAIAMSAEPSSPSSENLEDSASIVRWARPAISKILDALENPAKLADIGFGDFDGEELEAFLGTAAIDAIAEGKLEENKKLSSKGASQRALSSPASQRALSSPASQRAPVSTSKGAR